MGRMILKERVFSPTGRSLGKFSAVDLEPFDLQYTESDEPPKNEGQNASGGRKRVPDPVDSDPLKPVTHPDSSNNGGGVDPFADNKDKPKDGEGSLPDKWDMKGQDIDDTEQFGDSPPPAESLGGLGGDDDGSGEPPSSDEDWGGGGGSQEKTPPRGANQGQQGGQSSGGDESDGDPGDSQSSDGQGSSGKSSKSSSASSSASGSGDDGDDDDEGDYGQGEAGGGPGDYDDDDDGDGEDPSGSSSGGQSSLGGDPGDDDDSGEKANSQGSGDNQGSESGDGQQGNQGSQQGQQGGQSGAGSGGSDGGEVPPSSSDGGDEAYGEGRGSISQMLGDDEDDDVPSALADALKKMDSERSESSKTKEDADTKRASEEKKRKREAPSREETQAAKDILTDAVKRSKEERGRRSEVPGSSDNYGDDGYSDLEDAMLSAMGAGAMTSLFNPVMKADWRTQLSKVFDQATGMEIITNPNLFNKKIEDAPPGREDDVPSISRIAVLLDCSGSMGSDAFKQVISHVDTMLKVRKMNNVDFHIICWGTSNLKEVCSTHVKVKGRMFKQSIMKMKAQNWGTRIGPAFQACSQLVKNPDAIMVFTDMGIGDIGAQDDPIVSRYMKKYKKKIIYILTHNASMSIFKRFDPYAFNKKQWIKFKNTRN